MKKLIFVTCALTYTIFSQSLFGMQRIFTLQRQARPKVYPVLQQRNYAKNPTKNVTPDEPGITIDENGNTFGNMKVVHGDYVGGDKVGGNSIKIEHHGDFSGEDLTKRGWFGFKSKNKPSTDVAGNVIYAGPFSSVNTGFSFSPFTPVVYVARLLGKGVWFAGKKTKDFVFPNNVAQDTQNITSTGDVSKENIVGSSFNITSNTIKRPRSWGNIISDGTHDPSNKLITKKMDLTGGVQRIDFSTVGELKITQCPKPCTDRAACTNCQETLILTAPENIMQYLEQHRSNTNKDLTLGVKNNTYFRTSGPIEYHAEVKEAIKAIIAAGAVTIHSNNIKTSKLELNMSGATEFTAPIQVSTLEADISGSSKVTVSGTATKQEIDVSGAATFNAEELSSKTATVDTSGAASANLGTIGNKLVYDASGASILYFSGNPKVSGEKSGVAKVKKV